MFDGDNSYINPEIVRSTLSKKCFKLSRLSISLEESDISKYLETPPKTYNQYDGFVLQILTTTTE